MSYNGIGLPTARGTGTSGHIQKNVSGGRHEGAYARRQTLARGDRARAAQFGSRNLADRKIDAGILEHERRREVAARCFELRHALGDDPEVEAKVSELRARLEREEGLGEGGGGVHQMVKAKARENDRMKDAFERRERKKMRRERSLSPVRDVRHGRERSMSPVRDVRYGRERSMSPVRDVRYGRERRYDEGVLDYDGGKDGLREPSRYRRSRDRSPPTSLPKPPRREIDFESKSKSKSELKVESESKTESGSQVEPESKYKSNSPPKLPAKPE